MLDIITVFLVDVLDHGAAPINAGDDDTITHPILRAVAGSRGPVGLVDVDVHADVNDTMFGEHTAHGTWLGRALDEGLVDAHGCSSCTRCRKWSRRVHRDTHRDVTNRTSS